MKECKFKYEHGSPEPLASASFRKENDVVISSKPRTKEIFQYTSPRPLPGYPQMGCSFAAVQQYNILLEYQVYYAQGV